MLPDSEEKTHSQNAAIAKSASTGPKGAAIAPPAYGIDVIDRSSEASSSEQMRLEQELEKDFEMIVRKLDVLYYSSSDEEQVFAILKKWMAVPNPPGSKARPGSRYLETLFRKLQNKHKDVGILSDQTSSYYSQLFARSSRLGELRVLRDMYAPLFAGDSGVAETSFGGVLWESVKKGETRDQIYAYGKGVAHGAYAGAKGMVDVIRHPIETAKGVHHAVTHFDQTKAAIKKIWTEYKDSASRDPVKFAEMTGELVGQVEVALAGPKAIKTGGGLVVSGVGRVAPTVARWSRIALTASMLGVHDVTPLYLGGSEVVSYSVSTVPKVEQVVQAAEDVVQAVDEATQVTQPAQAAATATVSTVSSSASAVGNAGPNVANLAGVTGTVSTADIVTAAVAQASGQAAGAQTIFLMPGGFYVGQVAVPQAATPQVLGQQIEEPIRQLVSQHYGFSLPAKSPSAVGPDIEVPPAAVPNIGFNLGDVKPANARAVRTFWDQLDSWADKGFHGKAALFIYDEQGNVYLYGIYDL